MDFQTVVKEAPECKHALAAALKKTVHLTPPPTDETVIVCKEKVYRGIVPFECDGDCPEGAR